MRAIPYSLLDLRSLVRSELDHTRPASDFETDKAINYGLGKAVRAVLSVRPQSFVGVVDPFVIAPSVTEYDIGNYDPPLWKPTRLLVPGGATNQRTVRFLYKSLVDVDFQERESSGTAMFEVIVYDILNGMIARPGVNITAQPDVNHVTLDATTGLDLGTLVRILGAGAPESVPGTTATIPGTYYGTVVNISGLTVQVTPSLSASAVGATLVPLWRRMLKFAPTLRESLHGTLYYEYRPARLVAETDQLDAIIADHVDMVVDFAIAKLKRAVGDVDSRDYYADANSMRSEMIQDLDPASNQNTESLGSELWGD